MASLGEADLTVNATRVGKVRALSIYPDPAVFPRLGITMGFTLLEPKEVSLPSGRGPLVGYEVRDAFGELRLAESGPVMGSVWWAGPRRFVRSSSYGNESQVRFVCDLDHWRLEQIEKHRSGGVPRFWLQLWPMLVKGTEILDAEVSGLALKVPRDEWLEFVSKVGGCKFDVVEVLFPEAGTDCLGRSVERLRDARSRLFAGEYNDAVALCRKAIEGLTLGQRKPKAGDALRQLLNGLVADKRAEHYAGIASKLKQLSAFVHHETSDTTYSRVEAQFVVRTTEALVALVAGLHSQRLPAVSR